MKLDGNTHDLIESVRKAQRTQNAAAIGAVLGANIYLTDEEVSSFGITRDQADWFAELIRTKVLKAMPPMDKEARSLQEQIST